MKKLLFLLLMFPLMGFSQYVTFSTHYDAEHTAQHIIKGQVKLYLQDTIKYVVERKAEKYTIDCQTLSNQVKPKLQKVFAKGKPEFSGKTNGGYTFTVAVIDKTDETKILNFVTFHVNEWTQKIDEIEILLGQ